MRIAILGGGNGSHAAAADLAEQGHEVVLWRRDEALLAPLRRAGGIRLRDASGTRQVALAGTTAAIGEALAEMVFEGRSRIDISGFSFNSVS